MKYRRLVLLLGALLTNPYKAPGVLCLGAQHAIVQAQERKTPVGEWCQRPPLRSNKAHACACHQHDCTADPKDLNNWSAHTDAHCLNFCTVSQCRCAAQDCS